VIAAVHKDLNKGSADSAASNLVYSAYEKKSSDNITALVVSLKYRDPEEKAKQESQKNALNPLDKLITKW
jgi:serine/threonine protein phosphatase PrpC